VQLLPLIGTPLDGGPEQYLSLKYLDSRDNYVYAIKNTMKFWNASSGLVAAANVASAKAKQIFAIILRDYNKII